MRSVDERQLATIVAALRFFGRNYDRGQPPIAVREIAAAGGVITPLSPEETGALADALDSGTTFGSPDDITVVALSCTNAEMELSAYARPDIAWEAVGAYADYWWDTEVPPETDMPADPRERADVFFNAAGEGSSYECATLELRYEPKSPGDSKPE